LANSPRDRVEVTLHQYMPEFHMEHCVFAAFMSKGSSFRDCGKPCEKHQVELKDAYGHMHFLKADQECRNTMYRGSAQSAAYLVGRENSPGTWRFEALQERGETLLAKLTAYLGLLGGESELAQVVRSVGASEKYGVTEGQLAHAHAWKDRKKVTEAGR
jgi:putative protease